MTDQQKCPPTSQLQALVAGTLAGSEEAAVADHLAVCEMCQSQVDNIAAPAEFKADVAQWLAGSEGHSDALSKVIASAEADIRESSRELATGQPTVSVTGNSQEDSVLSGSVSQKRGYADVEKWLESDDDPAVIGRLDQFRLTEFIGRGGMGAVFKAEDVKLQRDVAVKVLSPELASNKEACERFLREARAIAAINHINIVTVHAVGEDAALPYFVMEYVEGHSLQEHLDRRGRLKDSETTRIARHVAKGLAAAHAQGIIHRDIKPANILIQKDSKRAKLTDFGLARASGDGSLTSAGFLVGTPAYLPPEALEEKQTDERSDLFSLGVTFYRAVTGRLPFEGPTPFATMQQVAKANFTPLRELVPDIAPELNDIINALLQRDPDQRIQSADELVTRLKAAKSDTAEPSDQSLPVIVTVESENVSGRSPTGDPKLDRRLSLLPATVLAVCSLVVYFAFFRTPLPTVEEGTQVTNSEDLDQVDDSSDENVSSEKIQPDSETNSDSSTGATLVAESGEGNSDRNSIEGLLVVDSKVGTGKVTTQMAPDNAVAAVSPTAEPSPAKTSVSEPRPTKPKPYAVISKDGQTRSEFDSLRDAILAATPHSTVEIQDSGRHTIRRPIALRNTPVTIAARDGVVPTIVADLDDNLDPMISTESDLALRGLILIAEGEELDGENQLSDGSLLSIQKAMLKCSGCRFKAREGASIAVLEDCPSAAWIDCELYGPHSVAIHWRPSADGYLTVEQSTALSRVFVSSPRFTSSANIVLSENAIANDFLFESRPEAKAPDSSPQKENPVLKMAVEQNLILSGDALINIEADDLVSVLDLSRGLLWQGQENTLPETFLTQSAFDGEDDEDVLQFEINGLSSWVQLPTVSETRSTTAQRLESIVPESVFDDVLENPEEFRRVIQELLRSRRLPAVASAVEETLANAGPDEPNESDE